MSANKRASEWCDVKNEINILKQAFRYLEIHANCNFSNQFLTMQFYATSKLKKYNKKMAGRNFIASKSMSNF